MLKILFASGNQAWSRSACTTWPVCSIFSDSSIILPGLQELHALTLATRSYALLVGIWSMLVSCVELSPSPFYHLLKYWMAMLVRTQTNIFTIEYSTLAWLVRLEWSEYQHHLLSHQLSIRNGPLVISICLCGIFVLQFQPFGPSTLQELWATEREDFVCHWRDWRIWANIGHFTFTFFVVLCVHMCSSCGLLPFLWSWPHQPN